MTKTTKSLPLYVRHVAASAANRLDPQSPHFRGSEAVSAALMEPTLRNYLQSWVLPQLTDLAAGDVPKWMRDYLAMDPIARFE
jgi:hypothetical protein